MEGTLRCPAVSILILLSGSLAGCSPAGDELPSTALQPSVPSPASPGDRADLPLAASAPAAALPDDAASLRNQILQLSEKAQQAESGFQFSVAAAIWQEVRELLVRGYGEQAWQVRNCELAIQAAQQEAAFTPHQLDRLKAIAEVQKSVAEASQAGRIGEALELANGLAPEVRELFGPDSWLHARFIVQLARLNQLAGKHDEAIPLCQEALGEVLRHAGPVHPELEALHGFLAVSLDAQGQAGMALANLKKATALAQTIWGDGSLEYAFRANEVGAALNTQGDYADAVRVLRACESIRREALGAEHPLVAHSRLNLGIACMGSGDLAKALELTSAAEPVFRQAGAISSDMLVKALRQRAAVLMLLNRPADAEPPLRELIRLVDETQRPDRQAIRSELQYRLAVCLGRQGKYAEAVREAQESLAVRSQLLGPAHGETTRTRDLLVTLLERNGETARADELRGAVRPAGFVAPER